MALLLQLFHAGAEHGLAQTIPPSSGLVVVGSIVWAVFAGIALAWALAEPRR